MYEFISNGTDLEPRTQSTLEWIQKHKGKALTLIEADLEVGSYSMLQTWQMWMQEIAEFMAAQGIRVTTQWRDTGKLDENQHPILESIDTRPISQPDCHHMFTGMFVGKDPHGNPLSWSLTSDGGEYVATKEQRLKGMDDLVDYCTQGRIPITIPRLGEYADYKEMQQGNGHGAKYKDIYGKDVGNE